MSVEYETTTPVSSSALGKFTARVKWFNNKAGYGFITVSEGPQSGSDIFVHHSVINVESQQYKYLVQGEYVEFVLSKAESGPHEFLAMEVSGIKGGKLMCETRFEAKTSRVNFAKMSSEDTPVVKMPSQRRPPVTREASTQKWVDVATKSDVKRPRGRPPKESM